MLGTPCMYKIYPNVQLKRRSLKLLIFMNDETQT